MNLTSISWHCSTYPLILILILGLFGNSFIFYIFLRPNFRSSTISKYMKILAVTDSVLLLVGMIPNMYRGFNDYDLLVHSDSVCVLHRFTMFFVGDISIWILTVITIDRLVAVVFPQQNSYWKSKKNTIIVLAFVVCLCFLKNFPILFTLTVVPGQNGTKYCRARKRFELYEEKIRPAISLLIYYLVPTLAMTTCTILIIWKMKIVVKNLKELSNPNNTDTNENTTRNHYSK